MEEKWIPIKKFESKYKISNLGRIKSLNRPVYKKSGGIHYTQKEKYMKFSLMTIGYYCVNLTENGKCYLKLIHRLMAEHFIPNPENKETVNHINGIKTHNHIDNLEWATRIEQIDHVYKIKLNTCQGVLMLDMNGNVLKTYNRVRDAINDGFCQSSDEATLAVALDV